MAFYVNFEAVNLGGRQFSNREIDRRCLLLLHQHEQPPCKSFRGQP
jgi:hypothetical protein